MGCCTLGGRYLLLLYIAKKRKYSDRGIIGEEDCIQGEEIGLREYFKRSEAHLLTSVRNENLYRSDVAETPSQFKDIMQEKRLGEWKVKVMHGQILRQTNNIRHGAPWWNWLKRGDMKNETDGLIKAAQY